MDGRAQNQEAIMTSVLALENALQWILDHSRFYDFRLERQPSGGFTLMYKVNKTSEWEYIP
jgi:hypothetical protein